MVSAPNNDGLRIRLGAAILGLATVAAIVFGIINFQQRIKFFTPDDGVSWLDAPGGVQAWHNSLKSSAANAGIRSGDHVLSNNRKAVHSAVDVTRLLWRIGLWSQAHYRIERGGRQFDVQLVTQPAERPASIENYLRIVGLFYLFIGLFIFARRWNATRAVHLYIFCLVSFVLYSFQYTGKLSVFDWEVYWAGIVARLLQPALLFHFALVFPERRPAWKRQARCSRRSTAYQERCFWFACLPGCGSWASCHRSGRESSLIGLTLHALGYISFWPPAFL